MSRMSNRQVAEAIYLSYRNGVTLKKVVEFLSRRNLLGKREAILTELEKVIDKAEGIVKVKTTSGKRLPSKTRGEIERALKKRYQVKKISIIEEIRPEVLGGFRLEARDEVIDLTFKHRLDELQKYLIGA